MAEFPNSAATANNDFSEDINLKDLLDTLLQHIWIVVGALVLALAVGVAYAVLARPVYKADALIQVEDQQPAGGNGMQELAEALGGGGVSSVAGEIEILRSREVVLDAITATQADINLSVANRFPLIGDWYARRWQNSSDLAEPLLGLSSYAWGGEQIELAALVVPESAYGKTLTLVAIDGGYRLEDEDGVLLAEGQVGRRVDFKLNGRDANIAVRHLKARPGTKFEVTKISPINAYRAVLAELNVGEAGRQSSIIRVSYQHPDLVHANALVNALARAYLTQNVERRSAEADQRLKFLDEQMPQIKTNVEKAEDALNSFRTKTNTVSIEKSTETLLAQAVQVEKGRLELELQRDALLQRYRPEHPAVKAVDEQLAATRRVTDKVNNEVNSLPAAQRDLLRLQRDADVSTQLYIAVLNNAQQLRIAKAGTIGNVRVIDFAIPDTMPVAPKKVMIVLVSGLAGLVLGVFGAFLLRSLRPTLREASEAEKASGLSVYATIPESAQQEKLDSHRRGKGAEVVPGRTQLLAMLYPEEPAVESLRSLRTGLAFALISAANKNIVISGATAALGKSFISANLSVLLASNKKRVLLIETDLRRPQLGRYFGYENVVGLSDVLSGAATLEKALVKGPHPDLSLDVLPSGTVPPNPGELLMSEGFGKLLESVQDSYDHVILDSAPVLPVADTLAVAQQASTVFLVARAEQSTANELRDALRKLEGVGVHPNGVIFNGVKRRRVGYRYGYSGYYGYSTK